MSFFPRLAEALHIRAKATRDFLAGPGARQPHRLAFAAGVISAAAFAPLNIWPVLPLAFALLFWQVEAAATPKAAARLGWCFSFGQLVAGLYWIAIAWQYQASMPVILGLIAVILLSAYLAVYAGLACAVAKRFWHRGAGRIFLFAACWALGEWLRGIMLTGFPWNLAGSAWLPVLPVAQMAALFGTYGLSLLMVLFGGALALMATSVAQAQKSLTRTGMTLLVTILAGLAYLQLAPTHFWPNLQVHIVQANIGQDLKWAGENFRKPLNTHLQMTQETLAARGPGIFIWPETAIPNLIDEEITTRYLISRTIGDEALLITGADRVLRSPEGEILAAYNSLMVLSGTGEIRDIYDKVHLVPFGEYLPMRSLLDPIGIARLAPGTIDFLPGPKRRTLDLDKRPSVGPLICYETIFPGQVTDRKNRPAWLLNVSNDAWFGRSSGPWQHLAQARLRSIEEGLPMVRSTPTGISAIIDGHGRVLHRSRPHEAMVLTGSLPKPLARTPYGRFGDFGFFVLAGVALLLGAWRTRTS